MSIEVSGTSGAPPVVVNPLILLEVHFSDGVLTRAKCIVLAAEEVGVTFLCSDEEAVLSFADHVKFRRE